MTMSSVCATDRGLFHFQSIQHRYGKCIASCSIDYTEAQGLIRSQRWLHEASVPGFRKGKAPLRLLYCHHRHEIDALLEGELRRVPPAELKEVLAQAFTPPEYQVSEVEGGGFEVEVSFYEQPAAPSPGAQASVQDSIDPRAPKPGQSNLQPSLIPPNVAQTMSQHGLQLGTQVTHHAIAGLHTEATRELPGTNAGHPGGNLAASHAAAPKRSGRPGTGLTPGVETPEPKVALPQARQTKESLEKPAKQIENNLDVEHQAEPAALSPADSNEKSQDISC